MEPLLENLNSKSGGKIFSSQQMGLVVYTKLLMIIALE
jgi:hypothetical protein